MDLPFSGSAFLDVFGAYDSDGGQRSDRAVMVLLAVHWLWSGVAYHWLHFRAINPAAAVFAAAFVVQGALFGWHSSRSRTDCRRRVARRRYRGAPRSEAAARGLKAGRTSGATVRYT